MIIFCEEKLEWWGNQLVKKFEDKLSGFHTIHECDGQTELQIDRQPVTASHCMVASAALVYSVMQEKGDFYNAYCTIEE